MRAIVLPARSRFAIARRDPNLLVPGKKPVGKVAYKHPDLIAALMAKNGPSVNDIGTVWLEPTLDAAAYSFGVDGNNSTLDVSYADDMRDVGSSYRVVPGDLNEISIIGRVSFQTIDANNFILSLYSASTDRLQLKTFDNESFRLYNDIADNGAGVNSSDYKVPAVDQFYWFLFTNNGTS